ncbi:MAG: 2-oxoacid:acceptor oxidoreductase family protein, partial [Mariniphaga sp.]|nr:2-oxoacid:acceptor oxidoreductase family protein [Mariniphaga sp.]
AIAGSAGSGAQLAANILAVAGMTAGLNATKKGEYPITVGTGFSVAEVILSREDINYSGIESPDVIIIISEDGLNKIKDKINDETFLVVDEKLGIPAGKNVITGNFQKISGKKGAALTAIAYWLLQSKLFSIEALIDAAKIIKNAEKIITAIRNVDLINKKM